MYSNSSIYLYINDGNATSPQYSLVPGSFLGINYQQPSPCLVDIDNDGDLDLFVGHLWNQVVYWENVGTPERTDFELMTMDYLGTPYQGDFCSIAFGDIDNDGDLDIIRGHDSATPSVANGAYLDLYLNIGSANNPQFILSEEHFLDIELINTAEPQLADIDNDGDLDLFVGDFCGGVSFWRNNEFVSVANNISLSPSVFTLHPCYPNPFNPATTISFTLDRALPLQLKVYSQLGQEISTIINDQITPGSYRVNWDASQFSSGVYFISLESNAGIQQTQKVILIK